MKKSRQEEILSLISKNDVETQEELAELLKHAGYTVTQATVSRDIRQLNLTKISGANGKQKYIPLQMAGRTEDGGAGYVIKTAAISADCAGNLLVIKTKTGMGMAVAVEIDDMKLNGMLGTIGSDDVVFCAVRSEERAEELKTYFLSVMSGGR